MSVPGSRLQATEAENAKLQSTLESLRCQVQRLHSLELEGADLEAWVHRAEQERRGVEREATRLRSSLEVRSVRCLVSHYLPSGAAVVDTCRWPQHEILDCSVVDENTPILALGASKLCCWRFSQCL